MKKARRIITLVIAVVVIFSQFALPAAALTSAWQARFRSFQQINQSNAASYPEHVPVLKLFFSQYDHDYWLLMAGPMGEADWDYTTYTNGVSDVISEYRVRHQLSAGTTVDADTWAAIASDLSTLSSSAAGYEFYVTKDPDKLDIIFADRQLNSPQITYWYVLPNGSSDIFEIGN